MDLDGGWGENILFSHLELFKQAAPERFQVFGGVDWSRWAVLGEAFPAWAGGRLRAQKEGGAQGLKIWKGFGLHVKDQHGVLVDGDDVRLLPVFTQLEDGRVRIDICLQCAWSMKGTEDFEIRYNS